jgi:quinoprotein glucose dehydrogenase
VATEDIRAFDVRTGRPVWSFHLLPQPGEPERETWENGSAEFAGAMGAWAPLSADEELGYVYVPTSSPMHSFYGGHRPGQNLFSNSLVCLDAKTGKRIWHYQLVHHDLWDYDLPSAPVLGDVTVDGKPIKAVMQLTKQGFVFAFDRVTGKPLWPIEERPVPPSTAPGEKAWPTQPFPTKPAPFDRQGVTVDDLIDFTPELRAEALEIVKSYVLGPLFTPPSVAAPGHTQGTVFLPGHAGAANWNGGAFDPETGILYVPSHTHPMIKSLVRPSPFTDSATMYAEGPEAVVEQAEEYSSFENARVLMETMELANEFGDVYNLWGPDGLPLVKPPYGRITAIDMNTGEHVWMTPNGNGPRDHPRLRKLNLPPLGNQGRAAPLLTKTLLFLGEGSGVTITTPRGGGGKAFRAYDKATGDVLWETELPAGTTGAPMTYLFGGKQYILVAVGDVGSPATWVALGLP